MARISGRIVTQLVAAGIALSVGVAVYLLDRQTDSVYFLARWIAPAEETYSSFGVLGNHLPTFVHVYAFILLTAVLAAASRAHAIAICLLWLGIDSLFEFAQMPVIARRIAGSIPDWFSGIPFLENTSAYFLAGTFDLLDLCSIAAGALAAYVTIVISNRRTLNHASAV
jgi:hypothetical protein